MRMMFKVFVLLTVASLASAGTVVMRPCEGGHPMPDFLESESCSSATNRCYLTRGELFSARAGITPFMPFSVMMTEIRATVLGIPFPFPVPEGFENACNFLEGGHTCPVMANRQYVWIVEVPVATTFPAISNMIIQSKTYLDT